MLPIGHFAFGAAMTTLLITVFLPRVEYPRLLAVMGGLWAVVPSVGLVVDNPVLAEFPMVHGADIFWLHHTFTVYLDPNESYLFASMMIVFLIGVTFIAEIREYVDAEPVAPGFQEYAMRLDEKVHAGGRFVVGSVIGPTDRDVQEA